MTYLEYIDGDRDLVADFKVKIEFKKVGRVDVRVEGPSMFTRISGPLTGLGWRDVNRRYEVGSVAISEEDAKGEYRSAVLVGEFASMEKAEKALDRLFRRVRYELNEYYKRNRAWFRERECYQGTLKYRITPDHIELL